MPRFFLSPSELSGSSAALTGENAAHAKVLRLKSGDEVTLCDGAGNVYRGSVSEIDGGRIRLAVQDRIPVRSEPVLRVSVYMAYAKSDKLEHVIQKATELGAYQIVAFPCSRCVSRPEDKSLDRKLDRWRKIAASAAEQSGRARIPAVRAVPTFQDAVHAACHAGFACLLYENEQHRSLRAAIGQGGFLSAAVMTGPEGGFDPAEVHLAEAAGMQICSLGPRILRCETAPLCALTALMFAAGELE